MWKIALNIVALLVIVFAVVYRSNYGGKDPVHDARALGVQGGDFVLQSEKGEVSLKDFKGKTLVLYFGFATCPDVCPMSLSYLNGVLNKFPKRDEVQVIFVSVDYKRDTADKVGKYTRFFNKKFVGLAGNEKQINEVTKKYNVYYKFIDMEKSEMGYTVDHTSKFFIIDKDGELRKVLRSEEEPEAFLEALSSVVK